MEKFGAAGICVIGLYFLIFGLRLLFQKGYSERRFRTTEEKNKLLTLSADQARYYNKYAKGLTCTIAGLGMVILGLLDFFGFFS